MYVANHTNSYDYFKLEKKSEHIIKYLVHNTKRKKIIHKSFWHINTTQIAKKKNCCPDLSWTFLRQTSKFSIIVFVISCDLWKSWKKLGFFLNIKIVFFLRCKQYEIQLFQSEIQLATCCTILYVIFTVF